MIKPELKRKPRPLKLFFALVLAGTQCSTSTHIPFDPIPEANLLLVDSNQPDCLAMVDEFCRTLYSPTMEGALFLPQSGVSVRRGADPRDFQRAYLEFAATRIQRRDRLPKDFKARLEVSGFFPKQLSLLRTKPRASMNLEDRFQTSSLTEEVGTLWNRAIRETVLSRLENSTPGFRKLRRKQIPYEYSVLRHRLQLKLLSEIALALWTDHPKWKRAVREFELSRQALIKVVLQSTDLSIEDKIRWKTKLLSVRLELPGSHPDRDLEACSKTEENAYYFPAGNTLTVCAGDLNAEDLILTLSHELAHSLDPTTSSGIEARNSILGQRIEQLSKSSCNKTPKYSCADWGVFKTQLLQGAPLPSIEDTYDPELLSCYHEKRPVNETLTSDAFTKLADEDALKAFRSAADRQLFLRLIAPRYPKTRYQFEKNPFYFRPCEYFISDSEALIINEEYLGALFFSYEMKCSNDTVDRNSLFEVSLDSGRRILGHWIRRKMVQEGAFSGRETMMDRSYAQPVDEDFADELSAKAIAMVLREVPVVAVRRARFLGNISWLCSPTNLSDLFPKESRALQNLLAESHSGDEERKRTLFVPELIETLQCRFPLDIPKPKTCFK